MTNQIALHCHRTCRNLWVSQSSLSPISFRQAQLSEPRLRHTERAVHVKEQGQ